MRATLNAFCIFILTQQNWVCAVCALCIYFTLFFNLKCTFIRLYDSNGIENVDWMRWNRISSNYKFIDSNRMIFICLRLCIIYISQQNVYLCCCSGKNSNSTTTYFIRVSGYRYIRFDTMKRNCKSDSNQIREHGTICVWWHLSMHTVKWFRNCISAEKHIIENPNSHGNWKKAQTCAHALAFIGEREAYQRNFPFPFPRWVAFFSQIFSSRCMRVCACEWVFHFSLWSTGHLITSQAFDLCEFDWSVLTVEMKRLKFTIQITLLKAARAKEIRVWIIFLPFPSKN